MRSLLILIARVFKPRVRLIAEKLCLRIADDNASFSQKIFDISMTEIKSMIESDGVLNDFRWESVAFV